MGIFGMGVVFGKMAADQRSAIQGWLRELASKQAQKIPN
jgi:hypothetical protein